MQIKSYVWIVLEWLYMYRDNLILGVTCLFEFHGSIIFFPRQMQQSKIQKNVHLYFYAWF